MLTRIICCKLQLRRLSFLSHLHLKIYNFRARSVCYGNAFSSLIDHTHKCSTTNSGAPLSKATTFVNFSKITPYGFKVDILPVVIDHLDSFKKWKLLWRAGSENESSFQSITTQLFAVRDNIIRQWYTSLKIKIPQKFCPNRLKLNGYKNDISQISFL